MPTTHNNREAMLDARESRVGERVNAPLDAALTAWFVLVILAFWGPYLSLPIPSAVFTALYGVFLLSAVALTALRVLRGREAARETAAAEERRLPSVK